LKIGQIVFNQLKFEKLVTGTFFWTVLLAATLVVANISCQIVEDCRRKLLDLKSDRVLVLNLHFILENCFSFVEIVDSKLIGLFIFVLSNLLTGLVNLLVETQSFDGLMSGFLLSIYCFLSNFVPFAYYYNFYSLTKS